MDPVHFGRIQTPKACGEHVVHLRLRCQASIVSQQAEPPTEVEILTIHEEGLIEAPGFIERSTPREHRAPASGEGFEIGWEILAIGDAETDIDGPGPPIGHPTERIEDPGVVLEENFAGCDGAVRI